jgi:O-antigen/teichoic acid export membrane protein
MPTLYTLSETTVVGIAYSRKTYYNLLISGVIAVINIVGNSILVPRFGALGAAASTGISYIFFFILRSVIGNKLWQGFSLSHNFLIFFL